MFITLILAFATLLTSVSSSLNAAEIHTEVPSASVDLLKSRVSFVVKVESEVSFAQKESGSGVLTRIDSVPYVLTSAHVLHRTGNQKALTITLSDGRKVREKAIHIGPYADVAAIELDARDVSKDLLNKTPELGNSLVETVEGDTIAFYGYSDSEDCFVKGASTVDQTQVFEASHRYDVMISFKGSPVHRGFSGGPILKDGKLAGLVTMGNGDDEGENGLAISAAEILSFVQKHVKERSSWEPTLNGFTGQDGAPNVVDSVTARSSAQAIGLRPGDKIVAVNGIETEDLATIQYETARRPFEEISLVVERGNKTVLLQGGPASTAVVADDFMRR